MFRSFLYFIQGLAQTILKEPVAKMLERVEFSEGLAQLRLRIGKPVSFLKLIRNYQALKEAHAKAQTEIKPMISDLDEPINEIMSTE